MPPKRSHSRSDLRRRIGTREVRERFLILCEGAVTETEYFNDLRRELRGTLVTIEISRERGDPLRLVEQAIRIRDEAAANARRAGDDNMRFDAVWCAFDVDEHARLNEAVLLAKRSSVSLAVSNPCFELWPLLHFDRHTSYVSTKNAQKLLQRHLPGYDKSLNCAALTPRRTTAVANAMFLEELHAKDSSGAHRNPSSGVHELVTALIQKAGSPIFRRSGR